MKLLSTVAITSLLLQEIMNFLRLTNYQGETIIIMSSYGDSYILPLPPAVNIVNVVQAVGRVYRPPINIREIVTIFYPLTMDSIKDYNHCEISNFQYERKRKQRDNTPKHVNRPKPRKFINMNSGR